MLNSTQLKRLRLINNLTQKELADELGITRNYISIIESQKRIYSKEWHDKYIDTIYRLGAIKTNPELAIPKEVEIEVSQDIEIDIPEEIKEEVLNKSQLEAIESFEVIEPVRKGMPKSTSKSKSKVANKTTTKGTKKTTKK